MHSACRLIENLKLYKGIGERQEKVGMTAIKVHICKYEIIKQQN